jgi:carbon storage regulator
MLVLTRKSEEKIIIGHQKKIIITILKIQGDKVSIGLEAPRDIPIWREELNDEVDKVVQHLQIDLSKEMENKLSDALAEE